MSERTEIVERIMNAWRHHDVDGVIAHMAENVEWHYHVGSRPIVGAAAMRKTLTKLAAHQMQVAWRLVRCAESADAVLVEGVDDYRNPAGVHVRVPYMGVFQFDGDKVAAWRDYVDLALMTSIESGEDTPAWITALVE